MTRNFVILRSTSSQEGLRDERVTPEGLRELFGWSLPSSGQGSPSSADALSGVANDETDVNRYHVTFPYSRLLLDAPVLRPSIFQQDLRDEFPGFARAIDSQFVDGNELVIVVDQVDLTELNPLLAHGWSSLVAMLILAFPDARWIFLRSTATAPKSDNAELKEMVNNLNMLIPEIRCGHSIDNLLLPTGNPLFDDRGLRDWVCNLAFVTDQINERGKARHLGDSLRKDHAVVLDEERNYREFHALILYGFGMRVESIESWEQAKFVLNNESEHSGKAPLLSLEDLYLNYPDQAVDKLSNLGKRGSELKTLEKIKNRRFVTVGHRQNDAKGRLNYAVQQRWLAQRRLDHSGRRRLKRREQLIHKPAAGVYHMRSSLGLERHFGKRGAEIPRPKRADKKQDGHSSPGRLLQIAEYLVGRAKRLRGNVLSVVDAVRGAVMAIQAHELLGGMTPTIWLDSITLQHEFEVTAECQFAGVQNHLDIRTRMRAVRKALQSQVAEYFGGKPSMRKQALLNGELSILERIVEVLRRYDQFDEEQQVMCRIRDIQRKLSFANRNPAYRTFQPLVWYIHKLVGSVPTFILAIVAWILILGAMHWLVAQRYIALETIAQAQQSPNQRQPIPDFDLGDGFVTAFVSFLGLGPADNQMVWEPRTAESWLGGMLVSFTVLLGFIHLGTFVAIVNSIIQRK